MPARGAKLHQIVREGVSYQVYINLAAEARLEQNKLAKYVAIPPATLRRRAKAGRFNPDESDRLRPSHACTCTTDPGYTVRSFWLRRCYGRRCRGYGGSDWSEGGACEEASARVLKRLSMLMETNITGPMDLIALGRAGLDPSDVDRLASFGLPMKQFEWIITPRTLRTRRSLGQRLTPTESDQLIRAMRLLALAVETFGSEVKAVEWLQKPLRQFEGQSAIDLLWSELGAALVENALVRIDEGYAA